MGCCVCYNGLFWEHFWLRDFGLFVMIVLVIDWWDSLSCLFWRFVWACFDWMIVDRFLLLLLWLINMIVYCDWLFIVKEFWLSDCGLFDVVVFVIDFAVVWCNFVLVFYWTAVILCERRKIMVGRCIAMLPLLTYVKKSALWFKRLIFWFGRVFFVVKTLLCSERRFASGTS